MNDLMELIQKLSKEKQDVIVELNQTAKEVKTLFFRCLLGGYYWFLFIFTFLVKELQICYSFSILNSYLTVDCKLLLSVLKPANVSAMSAAYAGSCRKR
jgi:hypothetical protein